MVYGREHSDRKGPVLNASANRPRRRAQPPGDILYKEDPPRLGYWKGGVYFH